MSPFFRLWAAVFTVSSVTAFAVEPPPYPKAVIPGLTIELVAQEPDVCTPTAITADAKGRIWVLQNNTHFRTKEYVGPPTDRILILDDFGPDGRARKITTYADGFNDGMNLLLLPEGDLIVSTRSETLRFHDRDGDDHGSERRTLLKMKTEAVYPHNGLSSLALGPDGYLRLGLGENRGMPWTLTGSDGTSVHGVDGGGVFRFDPEGGHLQQWVIGLWNPFGMAFDPMGRLFAVDNDPGAGSFCRLLQILRGGEYGYRLRYGGSIDYPFISWQGRWPGTLPPLCLVGEGPTGLLWVGDGLLSCTWSDFGVQRYRLEPNGAGFHSKAEWIIRGDHRFRPTGIAKMPDGSLVVSDWVDSSYEVHGKGRVWRIKGYPTETKPVAPNADELKLRELFAGKAPREEAIELLGSNDPYLRHGAVQMLVPSLESLLSNADVMSDPKKRLGVVLVARRSLSPQRTAHLLEWLQDEDPMIRREALQWIGEERLQNYVGQLDLALKGNVSRVVFDAYVAALDQFAAADEPSLKTSELRKKEAAARDAQILNLLFDDKRDAALRALALRTLPSDSASITLEKLRTWIMSGAEPLRGDAVRVLATRSDAAAQAELRDLARKPGLDSQQRADAVAGLVYSVGVSEETRAALRDLAGEPDAIVAREALRSLGPLATDADKAKSAPELPSVGLPDAALLGKSGDPAAGRRLFFHPNGPGCFNCHQVAGHGRAIGPDLTHLETFTPAQILTAIREPSKDIAPFFLYWHVKMKDGTEAYGVDINRNDTAKFYLIDPTGKVTAYRHDGVAERTALPVSMMPPALLDRFSARDVADLLAFLGQARE